VRRTWTRWLINAILLLLLLAAALVLLLMCSGAFYVEIAHAQEPTPTPSPSPTLSPSPSPTPSPSATPTASPTPRPTVGPREWPQRIGPLSVPTEMPTIRPGATPAYTLQPTPPVTQLPRCGEPGSGCRIVCDACPPPTLGGGGGGGGGGGPTATPTPLYSYGLIEENHQANDSAVWCAPAVRVQLPIRPQVYIRRCWGLWGLWKGTEYCAKGYEKWAGPQNRVYSFRLLHQSYPGYFHDWWHVAWYRLQSFSSQRYELTGQSKIDPSAWADQFYTLRVPTGTNVLGGWGSAAYLEYYLPGADVFDEWGNWGYSVRVRCKSSGWTDYEALFEGVFVLWDFTFDCDADYCDHTGAPPGAPPPGVPVEPPSTWPEPPPPPEYYPGCAPWELPECCRCEFDTIIVNPVFSETRCLGIGPLDMQAGADIINAVANFFGVGLDLQWGETDRYEICFIPTRFSFLDHPLIFWARWLLIMVFVFACFWLIRWVLKR